MQQALSSPRMRIRCGIALLLIGVDVISTSLVSYYAKQLANAIAMPWAYTACLSIVLFAFFWILETIVVHVQDIIFFPIINHTIRNLSYRTVKHIHQIPLLEYQKLSLPETMNGIRRISQSARLFIKTTLLTLAPSCLKIGVTAFVLIQITPLGIVFLPFIGLILFLLYKTTQWYTLARARAWQISDQVTLRVHDSLLNTERCRFFQKEEMQAIAKLLDLEKDCWQQTNQRLQCVHIVIGLVLGLILCGTLMAITLMKHHYFSVGDFVFVQSQLMAALIPLRHFSREFRQIAEALVDIEKIMTLLDIPTAENKYLSKKLQASKKRGIYLNEICFAYDEHVIFDKVSLYLEPGSTVGIMGENGSGKSTLFKLMSGLYQPQSGDILIDHLAIQHYQKDKLHKLIHYIPQHYYLFNNSLRNNLCHGILETIPDNDLLRILEKVQLTSLLEQLPHGLDTLLGEMGTILSGGEKQKIAIGRALLLKPKIVLLDETTNALSLKQEQAILGAILEDIPWVILSSHRFSAHTHIDHVFKIKDKQLFPEILTSPLPQKYASQLELHA